MADDATPKDAPAPPAAPAPAPAPKVDDLLAAAQVKAPHVTREFLAEHGLDDDYLARLAGGEEPPPPWTGPEPTVDLHRNGSMWQITPKGVKPEDVGKGTIYSDL